MGGSSLTLPSHLQVGRGEGGFFLVWWKAIHSFKSFENIKGPISGSPRTWVGGFEPDIIHLGIYVLNLMCYIFYLKTP